MHRGNLAMKTDVARHESSSASTDLNARAEESANFVRASVVAASAPAVAVAIVLGTGMNALAGRLDDRTVVPYQAVPYFPSTTVAGHAGNFCFGRLGGVRVAVLQGRFHYYEGHDLETVTFPIRVLQKLGVTALILTAATGGIRADLRPGSIVVVTDHLNLMVANPLRGLNDSRLGSRFPDMTEVYSHRLRQIAAEEAGRLAINLTGGVYAAVPGPSYETPAEIRMMRTMGADVVGMSTVPEAIVARHGGMEVLAFAWVANAAAGVVGTPITHQEVLEAGRTTGPVLERLIERVVSRIGGSGTDQE
jgi:purine-nucleoside phosphorylase